MMKDRRRARVGALALLLLLLSQVGAAAAKTEQPVVDNAIQVTNNAAAGRGHSIPTMAVHPKEPNTLVLAEGDAYSSQCSIHLSRDGGLTWSRAAYPRVPPEYPQCMFATTGVISDLAFAPDGTLYYAFVGFKPSTYHGRIFVARSSDLGSTWDTTQLPWIAANPDRSEFGSDAMPSIIVSNQDPNHVYVAWWSNNGTWNLPETISGGKKWCRGEGRIVARPWLAASTNGGRTFGNPVDMAPGINGCTTEPYLAAGPDGEIYGFFGETARAEAPPAPPAHLYFSVSRDRGKTFTVTPIHEQSGPSDGAASTSNDDWLSGPSPAVDPDNGNIYVAWEEMGQGVPQILLRRSTNGGRTWGRPIKLNDGDPRGDWDFPQLFPTVGVAPNGRIDVAWYDWRNDASFRTTDDIQVGFQDVYYTSSTDGGAKFSRNLRLNDRSIDRRFGPNQQGSILGPIALASTERAAYVAWDDTRNGNKDTAAQDVYFTRVRYGTPAQVFGGAGSEGGVSPWTAGFLGAAIAFAVGGLVVLAMAASRRDRSPAPAEPEAKPAQAPTITT